MKTICSAPRIAATFALAALGFGLVANPAQAGLFHRRTVVVQAPTVYVAPVQTVYTVPVSTVVTTPVPVVVPAPVIDSAVAPTTYVPTVSTNVVTAPVVSTYVPTVTTVPTVLVPARRIRVVVPRRVYLYGY
jgi:hypothetical protein